MAKSKKLKLDKAHDSANSNDKPDKEPIQAASEIAADEPTLADGKSAIVGQVTSRGRFKGYLHTYWQRKKWTVPATIVVVVLLVLALPFTRYQVMGLFIKGQFSVSVVDSTTSNPISDAHLQLGGVNAKTAANGKATLKVPLGNGTLSVSKQYYKSASDKVLVSYTKSRNSVVVRLIATGRQVPVTVTNRITGKPVANAELKVLDTTAKTNKLGQATIVLPADKRTLAGTVSAKNYNDAKITVQVTTQAVAANSYALTPSGSVYFLSNLSGKVDVVKTNLDGTNRKTVLAGTGNESPTGTVLLASRDWKYLALLAQRKATGNPELDLIDTSTDKMTNIDTGNATFALNGWSGHYFIYTVDRQNVPTQQPGAQAIKSYNADTNKLITLDQSQAGGTGNNWPYASESTSFTNVYILPNELLYSYNWTISAESYYSDSGQYHGGWHSSIISIQPDGTNKKDLRDFPIPAWTTFFSVDFRQYEPQALYIRTSWDGPATSSSSNNGQAFYKFEDGQVGPAPSGYNDVQFYADPYTTYLVSPSGNQTFWSEPADGKNILSVGNQNAQNSKKVAVLSDYSPYGWYTDNYLLVSKNSSELYIMPASGGSPVRISDYYKPSQFFQGYGGGYGGL